MEFSRVRRLARTRLIAGHIYYKNRIHFSEPEEIRRQKADATIRWRRMSQLDFFVGTLAPFLRASDSPMAMACFRLLTLPPLPPLPERSVPRFLRRIALFTVLPAALPYLRRPDFLLRELFLAAIWLPPAA